MFWGKTFYFLTHRNNTAIVELHFARAVHFHHPFPADRLIPFAANALQCIVNGEENPKIAPSFPLEFRHPALGGPSHGHKQHAQKFGKYCACGSGDICSLT